MARLPIPAQDKNTWGDVLNEFLRVGHNNDGTLRNVELSVRQFGAKGDGVQDDLPAFRAAIEATNALTTSGKGGRIFVPRGQYRLSADLRIDRSIVLYGEGAGRLGGSELVFDVGAGIIVLSFGDVTQPLSRRGDDTVLRDLTIRTQKTATPPTIPKDGILMKARTTIENCYIVNFSGNGIHIFAESKKANANRWVVSNCFIEDCAQNGMYVHGADSNAGVATSVSVIGCGGWGILDSSFLGNTYVGCLTEANLGGAYQVEGNTNLTLLLGCYSESDQPPSLIYQLGTVIGGDHGAGFVDPPASQSQPGLRILHRKGLNGFQVVNAGAPDIKIGIGANPDTALLWQSTDDAQDYRLKYDAATGWWDVVYANSTLYGAFSLSGGKATEGAGRVRFPRGLLMGTGANQIAMNSAAAPPVAGNTTHNKGEVIFNTNPVSGGYVGWVCTQAGNPGDWKPFGLIAA